MRTLPLESLRIDSNLNAVLLRVITSLHFQLTEVQEELRLRYKTQNIWTGSDMCTETDEGMIQVQHLTFNPFVVETLLKRQDYLYAQIGECREEDTARPLPSMVSQMLSISFYFLIPWVKQFFRLLKST